MKDTTSNAIQIGDINAFKKMLADAIDNKGFLFQADELEQATINSKVCVSRNDHHYPLSGKNKIEAADS